MDREAFRKNIQDRRILLDGATGTNLQQAGMPVGVCPEQWILEHRAIMLQLQRDFVTAGTEILYAPTFTANRLKLADYGLEKELVRMNRELVEISREAADGKAWVAGDLTMTGRQLFPIGPLSFAELIDIYQEQAQAQLDAGVDLFVVETMMSLQETRAAVLAIRELCDLPILTSLTFEEDGRSLFGNTPEAAVVVLQSLGADAVGMNCSTGPEGMLANVQKMLPYAEVPILAKPNAGLPELVNGKTIYPATPEAFAQAGRALAQAGARLLGGCCGTTPEHIRQLAVAVQDVPLTPISAKKTRVLASERKTVEIRTDGPCLLIGERINPTGKQKLQESLREGSLEEVHKFAREQEEAGAEILDVNLSTNGINEKELMVRAVQEVAQTVDCPLCIDSSYPEVIEAALRVYPGRALLNSITWETEKVEALLPLAKKYGALFIFLPISDAGIPETQEEKHALIEAMLKKMETSGIPREQMVVDALVATIGAQPDAARRCLETIAFCRGQELATVVGLSNISFGLPERQYLNRAFFIMAAQQGLTMAIANPAQQELPFFAAAADLLLQKEGSDRRYLAMAQARDTKEKEAEAIVTEGDPIFHAVLEGEKEQIVALAEQAVKAGRAPEEIINESLIPAINQVGVYFDQKTYFLPQLIASASAMETAIGYLEPMITKEEEAQKAETVVIATVEGDVHDIGKNLVALMLRNYGYHVIDLGKDVPTEKILQVAQAEHASAIGLSALMTTTMMRMKDVIGEAARLDYQGKIVIGGAAVTESFAEEIGADGYSPDAACCVKLLHRLLDDQTSSAKS